MRRKAYAAGVLGVFILVAWLRRDLFVQNVYEVLRQARLGGWPGVRVVLENLLFCAILLSGLLVIPRRADLLHDGAAFAAALAAGYLAEAWGTRNGLWAYYTAETPPLWAIPGWALGALTIDRLALWAQESFGERVGPKACRAGYGAFGVLLVGAFLAFAGARHWAVLAVLGAVFLTGRGVPRDFWVLAAGVPCALLADFWAMTNSCWTYYTQSAPGRWSLRGAVFGALFDPVVVLACLRVAAYGRRKGVRSR